MMLICRIAIASSMGLSTVRLSVLDLHPSAWDGGTLEQETNFVEDEAELM